MLSVADAVVIVAGLVGYALASLRWLRVAQREHYLPGSVLRFARRWWGLGALAPLLLLLGIAGVVLAGWAVLVGIVAAAVAAIGPLGLTLRGRTSPLAWTRRLRTLAVVSAVVAVAIVAVVAAALGWHAGAVSAAGVALGAPLVVDLAAALLWPLEGHAAARFVTSAKRRLREVSPLVVAITGSYGKTTTKGYVAELLSGRFQVLASPKSFNNQAGLARTVNDLLVSGTDILVAEMGTYGAGELASLCSWMVPEISVITAIGPVHLERFKSLEAILAAKSEITVPARVSVLNVDDPLLVGLADSLALDGREVRRCSGVDAAADVAVLAEGERLCFYRSGEAFGAIALPENAATVALSNVACAIAVAAQLGVTPEEIVARAAALPVADNRLQLRTGAGGATILDDTFNSNPAGTALALGALAATGAARRVVVTPGMVELGAPREENCRFGHAAAERATDVIVVGRTNRRALLEGIRKATEQGAVTRVEVVEHREQAVGFVRDALGAGDAVLYENDLPDHYP